MAVWTCRAFRKPAAVVGHTEDDTLHAGLERDLDSRGFGMPCDVSQALLCNAVDGNLGFLGERWEIVGEAPRHLNAALVRELPRQLSERAHQPELLEHF